MDDLFNDVVKRIRNLSTISKMESPMLFIKVENDTLFVNELSYMPNGINLSKEEIDFILSSLRLLGAKDYVHAENAVYFEDAAVLLNSRAR